MNDVLDLSTNGRVIDYVNEHFSAVAMRSSIVLREGLECYRERHYACTLLGP